MKKEFDDFENGGNQSSGSDEGSNSQHGYLARAFLISPGIPVNLDPGASTSQVVNLPSASDLLKTAAAEREA